MNGIRGEQYLPEVGGGESGEMLVKGHKCSVRSAESGMFYSTETIANNTILKTACLLGEQILGIFSFDLHCCCFGDGHTQLHSGLTPGSVFWHHSS